MKYLLYTKAGEVRMYFRLSEEGVELSDGQVFWTERGRRRSAHLKDLREVNLKVNFGGRHRVVGIMGLRFRNGTLLNIFSANAIGWFDARRSATYRSFVTALHEAIPEDSRRQISFTTGGTNNKAARLSGVLILALVLAGGAAVLWSAEAITAEILIILGFSGLFFVWPLYRLLSANTGDTYRPHRIPEDLMP